MQGFAPANEVRLFRQKKLLKKVASGVLVAQNLQRTNRTPQVFAACGLAGRSFLNSFLGRTQNHFHLVTAIRVNSAPAPNYMAAQLASLKQCS
ncbi:MAG: hypothetical protein O7F12_04220, partial [Nitrospirae bacterium]|nr:hypothetical protein [Nitrospirota bacterium]